MNRWKERLWVDPILHGIDAVDSFYAFAQACYHLVDWLEKDHSQPVRRAQATAHVSSSAVLALCRAICHGSKHATLGAKKTRVTTTPTHDVIRFEDEPGREQEIPIDTTTVFVDWNGEKCNAETFAQMCVAEWDRFLREQGLLGVGPVVTFMIERVAYSLLRDEATGLSPEAQAAISNAARVFGEIARTVSCQPDIAREIREWLNEAERGYPIQGDEGWKSRACHSASDAITEALASQAPALPSDSN